MKSWIGRTENTYSSSCPTALRRIWRWQRTRYLTALDRSAAPQHCSDIGVFEVKVGQLVGCPAAIQFAYLICNKPKILAFSNPHFVH